MAALKINMGKHTNVSPQMDLLQLRWQQIRQELLRQVAFHPHPQAAPARSQLEKKAIEAV